MIESFIKTTIKILCRHRDSPGESLVQWRRDCTPVRGKLLATRSNGICSLLT